MSFGQDVSLERLELVLKETIIEILGLEVGPEEIGSSEPLFDGLGLDSVATIEFVVSIEERFGIEVAEDELSAGLLASIETFARYLLPRIGVQ